MRVNGAVPHLRQVDVVSALDRIGCSWEPYPPLTFGDQCSLVATPTGGVGKNRVTCRQRRRYSVRCGRWSNRIRRYDPRRTEYQVATLRFRPPQKPAEQRLPQSSH